MDEGDSINGDPVGPEDKEGEGTRIVGVEGGPGNELDFFERKEGQSVSFLQFGDGGDFCRGGSAANPVVEEALVIGDGPKRGIGEGGIDADLGMVGDDRQIEPEVCLEEEGQGEVGVAVLNGLLFAGVEAAGIGVAMRGEGTLIEPDGIDPFRFSERDYLDSSEAVTTDTQGRQEAAVAQAITGEVSDEKILFGVTSVEEFLNEGEDEVAGGAETRTGLSIDLDADVGLGFGREFSVLALEDFKALPNCYLVVGDLKGGKRGDDYFIREKTLCFGLLVCKKDKPGNKKEPVETKLLHSGMERSGWEVWLAWVSDTRPLALFVDETHQNIFTVRFRTRRILFFSLKGCNWFDRRCEGA